MVQKVVLYTHSAPETVRLGKHLGKLLQAGDVVALGGELGAGKTQLIKGLAAGIGIGNPHDISSPSFMLVNEHDGKIPFNHIDLFRLKGEKEAEELGLDEYFEGKGVTAIEWAERIPSLLPQNLLLVHIRYTGKNARSIEITAKGKRYEELIDRLRID